MSESDLQNRRLHFRFFRTDGDRPTVPASLLIQTLEGAQRALWLIALSEENRDVKSRVRIPAEIERGYQLRCEVPTEGSYALPAYVEAVQPSLEFLDQVDKVVGQFRDVAVALGNQNRGAVAGVIRDSMIRRRVVEAFQQLGPKPGSGWHLDLGVQAETVRLGEDWQRKVRKLFVSSEAEPDRETVNGELIEINFIRHQFMIRPKGSNRTLTINYAEELEDLLVDSRRELIQVTGRVLRDEDGELKDIYDVEEIAPLDLSPLELSEVEYSGLRLKLRQPVQLQPKLSEDQPPFLTVEYPELGIDVLAGQVTGLMDEIAVDLAMLWRTYALAEDQELAPQALALKHRLLEAIQEVRVGK